MSTFMPVDPNVVKHHTQQLLLQAIAQVKAGQSPLGENALDVSLDPSSFAYVANHGLRL